MPASCRPPSGSLRTRGVEYWASPSMACEQTDKHCSHPPRPAASCYAPWSAPPADPAVPPTMMELSVPDILNDVTKSHRDVLQAPLTATLTDRKSTRLNSSHLGISYAVF